MIVQKKDKKHTKFIHFHNIKIIKIELYFLANYYCKYKQKLE